MPKAKINRKQRAANRANKKNKLGVKGKQKKQHPKPAAVPDSDSDVSVPSPDSIQRLLDPYTKDQLIGFLLDAAASKPDLVARIRAIADTDVSHRKVFVHGLGWDTTTDTLREAFQPFGPIEDCKVVVDKATGRAKGYGFVLFASRSAAAKALKEPEKKIKNRVTHSQLASIGPVQAGGGPAGHNAEGRRVYVSNVHTDADAEKLKLFFSKFGEIEAGPFGFDMNTGKSRGFALFVFKTQEGAMKALEEPYKMFEGHQLHCQKATDPSHKVKAAAAAPPSAAAAVAPALMGAAQQPVLAAMAAAQNLAMFQNPAYATLFAQNPLLVAAMMNPAAAAAALNPAAAAAAASAALNPAAAAAMNQAAGFGASQGQGFTPQGQGYTSSLGQDYGRGDVGAGTGSSSLLGAYGSQGAYGAQGTYGSQGGYGAQSAAGLNGLPSYQGLQYGQSSSGRPSSSFGGFPSHF